MTKLEILEILTFGLRVLSFFSHLSTVIFMYFILSTLTSFHFFFLITEQTLYDQLIFFSLTQGSLQHFCTQTKFLSLQFFAELCERWLVEMSEKQIKLSAVNCVTRILSKSPDQRSESVLPSTSLLTAC